MTHDDALVDTVEKKLQGDPVEEELRAWWAKVGPVHSAHCRGACPYGAPTAIHPPGFKHGHG